MSEIKAGDRIRLPKKMPNQQWTAERMVLAVMGEYLLLFSDLNRPDGVFNIHAVKTSTVTKVEPPAPKAKPGVVYVRKGAPYKKWIGMPNGNIAFLGYYGLAAETEFTDDYIEEVKL